MLQIFMHDSSQHEISIIHKKCWKNKGCFCFKSLSVGNCWHLNILELEKVRAQLVRERPGPLCTFMKRINDNT